MITLTYPLYIGYRSYINVRTKTNTLHDGFWLFLLFDDGFWLFLLFDDGFWLFLLFDDGFWLFLLFDYVVSLYFLLTTFKSVTNGKIKLKDNFFSACVDHNFFALLTSHLNLQYKTEHLFTLHQITYYT